MKKIIIFSIIIFVLPFVGSAEIGLSVAPQKFEITVFPGRNYEGQFKIHNPSSIALPVDLRVIVFGAEQGTGEMILGQSNAPDNPTSWINFEQKSFLLAPKENKRVLFNIEIPLDAPEGGYYMIVQFQPRVPDFQTERRGAKTVPSIGVPVLIATTELSLDGQQKKEDVMEVTGFAVVPEERINFLEKIFNIGKSVAFIKSAFAQDYENYFRNINANVQVTRERPNHFVLSIKNNDIFHFQPEGKLIVYDALGREVATTQISEVTILPGMSRNFDLKINETNKNAESFSKFSPASFYADIIVGRYKAKLDLKGYSPVYNEIVPLDKNLSFSVFTITPFFFWGILLLLSFVFFWKKKRVKMALKVLFSRNKNQ